MKEIENILELQSEMNTKHTEETLLVPCGTDCTLLFINYVKIDIDVALKNLIGWGLRGKKGGVVKCAERKNK